VPERRLAEAAEILRPVAASLAPFEVTLGEFGHFAHSARSATLWLDPTPAERVRALQAALQAAMPWCGDVGRFAGGYRPHLSVGRFGGGGEAERAAEDFAEGWAPVRFVAREVCLIARSGRPGDPFTVRVRLPLAGL
jgi:2'-5' RNA ligase